VITFKQFLEADLSKLAKDIDSEKGNLKLTYDEFRQFQDVIPFVEKPDSWDYIDEHTVPRSTIEKTEKSLGFKLETFSVKELFGKSSLPNGPLADAHWPENTYMGILETDRGSYIFNTTGARSYVRFWAKIK